MIGLSLRSRAGVQESVDYRWWALRNANHIDPLASVFLSTWISMRALFMDVRRCAARVHLSHNYSSVYTSQMVPERST